MQYLEHSKMLIFIQRHKTIQQNAWIFIVNIIIIQIFNIIEYLEVVYQFV